MNYLHFWGLLILPGIACRRWNHGLGPFPYCWVPKPNYDRMMQESRYNDISSGYFEIDWARAFNIDPDTGYSQAGCVNTVIIYYKIDDEFLRFANPEPGERANPDMYGGCCALNRDLTYPTAKFDYVEESFCCPLQNISSVKIEVQEWGLKPIKVPVCQEKKYIIISFFFWVNNEKAYLNELIEVKDILPCAQVPLNTTIQIPELDECGKAYNDLQYDYMTNLKNRSGYVNNDKDNYFVDIDWANAFSFSNGKKYARCMTKVMVKHGITYQEMEKMKDCCPRMYVFRKDAQTEEDKINCNCPNITAETASLYPLYDGDKPLRVSLRCDHVVIVSVMYSNWDWSTTFYNFGLFNQRLYLDLDKCPNPSPWPETTTPAPSTLSPPIHKAVINTGVKIGAIILIFLAVLGFVSCLFYFLVIKRKGKQDDSKTVTGVTDKSETVSVKSTARDESPTSIKIEDKKKSSPPPQRSPSPSRSHSKETRQKSPKKETKKRSGNRIVLPPARRAPGRVNQTRGRQIRREAMQPAQPPYREPQPPYREPQQPGQNGWYQYNTEDYENPGMYQYPVQQEYQDPYYQPQEGYSQQQEVYNQQESDNYIQQESGNVSSEQEYTGSSAMNTEETYDSSQKSAEASSGGSNTGGGSSDDVSDSNGDDDNDDATSGSS